ncbi:hypothetical protein [Natronorubrum daqingense]|uniref:Uncharacterized protein n=1 Tax=Natronorubrum daqingense TaxID=588898 RepID=A0A1N7ELG6_9EURY|nr:hypothetical protein [Natronorubrum daqingense]APX97883.1 hypothetical protein BB347_15375 [Natronorubrum daqingense]SIR88775.1 hypothetical protein SAMN05421809_2673 [Natronorubrum daqingense]
MGEKYKIELLPDSKTCYRYLQAGFSIIVLTFLVGLLALAVPNLIPIYDVMVMPALFVGLGLLLYGVGTHLHIMHLNMLEMREEDGSHK